MCMIRGGGATAAKPIIAARDSREANQAASIEAQLRRKRAGAAAQVLTSPIGIPSGDAPTRQLGAVK